MTRLSPASFLTAALAPARSRYVSRLLPWLLAIACPLAAAEIRLAPLAIDTACPLQGFDIGIYGTDYLAGSGGQLPFVWSISAGSLPTGLTIFTAGNPGSPGGINGTPGVLGTQNFTIRLTDSLGAFVDQPCSLSVNPLPSISPYGGPPALEIGQPFTSPAFTSSGGTAPVILALMGGSQVPPGLSFTNGIISGTPTTIGSYSATATATDSLNQYGATAFTLISDNAHPAPAVTRVRPASYPAGEAAFILEIFDNNLSFRAGYTGENGYSFPGTQARWSGALRNVYFYHTGAIGVQLLASDVAVAGTYSLELSNAAPGGGITTLNYPVVPAGTRAYFSNPGKNLITIFDAGTLAAIGTWSFNYPENIAISPDGYTLYIDQLAALSAIRAVDVTSGFTLGTVGVGAPFSFWSMAVSPGGDKLFLCCDGGASGAVRVVDTATMTLAGTIPLAGFYGRRIALSPDGHWLMLSSFGNSGVRIYDTATYAQSGQISGLEAVSPDLLAFSRDGRQLVAVAADSLFVADVATRRVIKKVKGVGTSWSAGGNWRSLALSSDATKAYITRSAADSVVADLAAGSVASLPAPTGAIIYAPALSLSDDDSQLFLAGQSLEPFDTQGLLSLSTPAMAYRGTIAQTGGWLGGIAVQTSQYPIALSIPSPLPGGYLNRAYQYRLLASGGRPAYQWSIIAGALPPGLTLAADGALSGTPGATGVYSFTVSARDLDSVSASEALQLTIGGAFAVVADPLLNGIVAEPYSATLQGIGGVPPYTWSVIAGALPAGLTLDGATGVISGTPTTGGTASFTAQISDSTFATTSSPFTLIVLNTAPSLVTVTPSSGFADGQPRVLTLDGSNFQPGASVLWNGFARSVTYISPVQLTVQLLGSDFSAPGTATLTVMNPTPGGGRSDRAFQICTAITGPANSLRFAKQAPNIALSWTAGGGDSFAVKRCSGMGPTCTYITLATQAGTTYNDAALGSTFSFRYQITAQTACGAVP